MSDSIQLFSREAFDCLEREFVTNLEIYQTNLGQEEFWQSIEKFLKDKNLSKPIVFSLACAKMKASYSGPKDSDSWQEAGFQLYNCFGDIDEEVLMRKEFWAYIAHRYFHSFLIRQDKAVDPRQYFLDLLPRGFYKSIIPLGYLAAKWTADMLKDDQNNEARLEKAKLLDYIKAWTSDSDTVYRVIDRRPFSSQKLRNFYIRLLVEEKSEIEKHGKYRDFARDFSVSINRICGGALVEVLDRDDLEKMLRDEYARVLKRIDAKSANLQ